MYAKAKTWKVELFNLSLATM